MGSNYFLRENYVKERKVTRSAAYGAAAKFSPRKEPVAATATNEDVKDWRRHASGNGDDDLTPVESAMPVKRIDRNTAGEIGLRVKTLIASSSALVWSSDEINDS